MRVTSFKKKKKERAHKKQQQNISAIMVLHLKTRARAMSLAGGCIFSQRTSQLTFLFYRLFLLLLPFVISGVRPRPEIEIEEAKLIYYSTSIEPTDGSSSITTTDELPRNKRKPTGVVTHLADLVHKNFQASMTAENQLTEQPHESAEKYAPARNSKEDLATTILTIQPTQEILPPKQDAATLPSLATPTQEIGVRGSFEEESEQTAAVLEAALQTNEITQPAVQPTSATVSETTASEVSQAEISPQPTSSGSQTDNICLTPECIHSGELRK